MRYDVLLERLRFCILKPLRGNVLKAAAGLTIGMVRRATQTRSVTDRWSAMNDRLWQEVREVAYAVSFDT